MSNIKSITTARAFGSGNNGNWVARMRFTDGAELFGGLGAGYTLAQAQAFIRANPTSEALRDPFTRAVLPQPYQQLLAGVVIG